MKIKVLVGGKYVVYHECKECEICDIRDEDMFEFDIYFYWKHDIFVKKETHSSWKNYTQSRICYFHYVRNTQSSASGRGIENSKAGGRNGITVYENKSVKYVILLVRKMFEFDISLDRK